ncbi:hypothetical protein RYX36_007200 [Vicia faba]
MESENIDWDSIDSTFVPDEMYEGKSLFVNNCGENGRPICSRNLDEDTENKNPNFTATNFDGGTNNKLKKPLLEKMNNSKENYVRSDRRLKLKSTFSA